MQLATLYIATTVIFLLGLDAIMLNFHMQPLLQPPYRRDAGRKHPYRPCRPVLFGLYRGADIPSSLGPR
ncbi:MAG: hypothetical protein U5N55_05670 [Cypionkella sp.]|nr:hypothetical protein [Cypionkella sp.]